MDKPITKPRWSLSKALALAVAAAILLLAAVAITRGTDRLSVDASRLSISTISTGEFREYYPFDGIVVPETSVYLDLEEGGRVEEIFTKGGQWVEQGTPILRLSNTSLQRTIIDSENQLLENLDQISNTQITRARDSLILKDQLLDMNYKIQELEKKFERYQQLSHSKNNPLTREDYEAVRDELAYQQGKRDLLQERIKQEDLLVERQLARASDSVEQLNQSLALLSQLAGSLKVSAPIAGQLSSINAEVGQNVGKGERIGQIDILDQLKIHVTVDQYYAANVVVGTEGKFKLGDNEHPVVVRKVYPEVVNNAFAVDVDFIGALPDNIRRGQALTVELNWGVPKQALMIRKGGFYQHTGGRWVYLLSQDGTTAAKVEVRLGKQNPQAIEVLDGLREGDRVITSGYENFNDMALLELNEAL
ncbi:MAG: HlyD family efflux transporter periplasmic adaptor subunit [Pseudomonadales bacterium]|jgi:HlyD family secretion protein|nr:HlyD family efflux transporter periplasmic adaptor subunit [Pseudomonadales bacterium]